MGAWNGEVGALERVEGDIRCAIDQFFASVPGLKDVVIWGLCDAASAALFYAHQDARVSGLVLLNPWVRTEQGVARAHLRHYYLRRLFQASLWHKLVRGEFNFLEAAGALARFAVHALGHQPLGGAIGEPPASEAPLPDRIEEGLRRVRGRCVLILIRNHIT